MANRIYVCGESGGVPRVGWIDASTYDYTALANPPGSAVGWSVAAIADDDVWLGTSGSQYPRVIHWNGVTWTTYDFDWMPSSGSNGYRISGFLVISSDEVYCSGVDVDNDNRGRVWKWNGTSWADFINAGASGSLFIMPGSTANDMWLFSLSLLWGFYDWAHWNGGEDPDEQYSAGVNLVNSMWRMADGFVYNAVYDGRYYRRNDVWDFEEVANVSDDLGAEDEPTWYNADTDEVWSFGANAGVGDRVSIWDGASVTKEDPSLPGTYHGISGTHVDGKTTVAIAASSGGVQLRHSDTGVWSTKSVGYTVYAVSGSVTTTQEGLPFLQNQDPSPNETNVPINRSLIEFDIVSPSTTINASSIDAYVDGFLAFSNEAFNSPFNGLDAYFDSIISAEGYDGYKVVLDYTNTPWEISQTIIIDAYGQDINGLEVSDTWSFTTETDPYPPFLDGYDPDAYEKFVPIYSTVSFNILDTNGVALNTIDAYVDGHLAIGSGIIQSLFNGADAYFSAINIDGYDGYSYVLDYEYLWGADKQIDVRVIAEDTIGNLMDITYPFYTPENIPPIVINKDPQPNEEDVYTNTNIEFDIVSNTTEILSNTIDAYVDGVLAFTDENFTSSFDGYFDHIIIDDYDGYKLIINPDNNFDSYDTISVQVNVEDAYGFTTTDTWDFTTGLGSPIYSWEFSIMDYIAPWLENQFPSGIVDRNTLVSVDILDDYLGVDFYSIDAYLNGIKAFSNGSFIAPYDGISSSISTTNIDGYDGYHLVIDKTTAYDPNLYEVRIKASDAYGNQLDDTFYFNTEDYIYPWIDNFYPTEVADKNTLISFDVLDNLDVDKSSIKVYIGTQVFSGPSTFISPYTGTISSTNVDGYDGYHLVLDKTSIYDSGENVDVRIVVRDDYGNETDETYSFSVEDYISPWLANTFPSTPAEVDSLITFDLLDDYSGILQSSIQVYIDGYLALSNDTFYSPYDGTSSVTPSNVGGYDGYSLVFDRTSNFISGSNHTVQVSCSDAYGNTLTDSFSFRTVLVTTIENLEVNPYEITLDLTFSTEMLNNADLISSANYTFNDGMYTRKVEALDNNKVRLWVENFYGEDTYTLNVSPNVKNLDGRELVLDSYDISPFESTATFTNSNGLVRTWHDSHIVLSDTQRVYLAGTRGIDVFRKSGTSFFRWAQIFDAYGIDAMYVANYPSDLVIVDNISPTLEDQVPAPSSFASPTTRISFKVVDSITAVEITSLTIYINGEIIFAGGYGGWNNGWTGRIEIEHHQLSVEIWKSGSLEGTVIVRVMAEDLMGNTLDSTYTFGIIEYFDGFGGDSFGFDPFGNP